VNTADRASPHRLLQPPRHADRHRRHRRNRPPGNLATGAGRPAPSCTDMASSPCRIRPRGPLLTSLIVTLRPSRDPPYEWHFGRYRLLSTAHRMAADLCAAACMPGLAAAKGAGPSDAGSSDQVIGEGGGLGVGELRSATACCRVSARPAASSASHAPRSMVFPVLVQGDQQAPARRASGARTSPGPCIRRVRASSVMAGTADLACRRRRAWRSARFQGRPALGRPKKKGWLSRWPDSGTAWCSPRWRSRT